MPRACTSKFMVFVMSVAALMLLSPNVVSARPLALQDNSSTSSVVGNSYTSPSFGYAITWTSDWTVSDELSQDNYDKLVLDNGVATVYFEGVVDSSDVSACIDTLVSSLQQTDGASDVVQLQDGNAPAGGAEDGRAWVIYTLTYTSSDGKTTELAEYLDCRSIVAGESLLVITMLAPAADLQSQIDPLSALLQGLSLDGSQAPDGGTGDSGTVVANGDLADFILLSAKDIDQFWTFEFPLLSGGDAYESVAAVVAFDKTVTTDCGAVKVGDVGPFYCPPDQTIYYDLPFGQLQVDNFGSNSVIAVTMAHEIAHHVQNLMRWKECQVTPCLDPAEMTSQEFELQADCFAGAWVADAETRGRLGSFDVETNVTQFALLFGDEGIGNTADPGTHGKGARRVYEFLTGYYNGVLECLKISAATDPARNGGVSPNGEEPKKVATEEPGGTLLKIGEAFEIQLKDASVTMTVTSTETTDSLGGGIDAKGTFLVVYFSLNRDAAVPGPFPYGDFIVTDSDGNEYEVDAAATDALLNTSDALPDGINQEIESGVTYNLAFIFDVPANASGYILGTADGKTRVTLDI